MISEQLAEIYQALFERFGPQHWWPGQTQFEIVTGAILTQNTSWANVEKAIANLKCANCLTPDALYSLDRGPTSRQSGSRASWAGFSTTTAESLDALRGSRRIG